MTTTHEAFTAVGMLTVATSFFGDDEINRYAALFEKHTDDGPALIEVCERIGLTWKEKSRPVIGVVLDAYREHPRVRGAREDRINAALAASATSTLCDSGWITEGKDRRPCPRCNPLLHDVWMVPENWSRYLNGTPLAHLIEIVAGYTSPPTCRLDTRHDPDHHIPTVTEGLKIARDAYEAQYGRKMGADVPADPAKAEAVIMASDLTDRDGNHVCHFMDVLDAFNGDFGRANVSLHALGRRLTGTITGTLVLGPVPQPSETVYEPRTRLPATSGTPGSAEGRLEAGSVMADALADTAARFTDEPLL